MGLLPTLRTETPAIPRFKPRKAVGLHWRAEIVSDGFRKFEKFISYLNANCVAAMIFRTSLTATSSMKPSPRLQAAGFQDSTQHIFFIFKIHTLLLRGRASFVNQCGVWYSAQERGNSISLSCSNTLNSRKKRNGRQTLPKASN